MKYKLLILIAAMAAAGCSKSDTPETSTTTDSYEASTVEIGFNTTSDETKAAALMTDSNFKEFCVSAYYHSEDDQDDVIVYRTGQAVTKDDDGDWTYSPTMYWPTNGSLQFFAYSPYDSSIILSGETDEGYPKIYFTPETDASNQVDFMTAQTSGDINSNGVSFTFAHSLAQVRFSAKYSVTDTSNEAAIESVDISSIRLSGVRAADYGVFTENSFYWHFSDENTDTYTYTTESHGAVIYTDDYTSIVDESGYLLLTPQTLSAGAVTISVNIDVTTASGYNDLAFSISSSDLTVSSEHDYKAGKILVYNITIEVDIGDKTVKISNITPSSAVWTTTDGGSSTMDDITPSTGEPTVEPNWDTGGGDATISENNL